MRFPFRLPSIRRTWGLLTQRRPRRRVLLAAIVVGLLEVVVPPILARRRVRPRVVSSAPGLLCIQFDGVSMDVLEPLIAAGRLRVIARLLSSGQATLDGWIALLPPTTPASQAGILHGRNENIPGFRWFDKGSGRLVVASHPGDAAEIVRRISNGRGLLADGGISIGNLVTGDASRSFLTTATVQRRRAPGTLTRSRGFFLRPSNYVALAALMIGEFGAEVVESVRQSREHRRPRIRRGFVSAVERALSNGALRVVSTVLVVDQMDRGAPIIYVDFTGYDTIAHHSGPDRPEALHAVEVLDRAVGHLLVEMRHAARPYELVILSDHGQSTGATFRQRYGEELDAVISCLAGARLVRAAVRPAEHGLGRARSIGTRSRELETSSGGTGPSPIVFAASGSLGHVYFSEDPGRMSLDAIETAFPGLIQGLVGHPGIGLVMVRGTDGQAVMISRVGRRHADGTITGSDPVAPYGDHAVLGLLRLDGFDNVGDLVILTSVDPVTGHVPSIENLVGSHGGLGGPQTRPFIVHPANWPIDGTPVGAPAIYDILRRWRDALEPVSRPA